MNWNPGNPTSSKASWSVPPVFRIEIVVTPEIAEGGEPRLEDRPHHVVALKVHAAHLAGSVVT